MAEAKIGSAALTITIDKAQVAAEAAAAIKPAIENAGAEASKALTSTAGASSGIQQMIDQQKQLAATARESANATAQAINQEAAAADQAGSTATSSGNKLRGLGSAASAMSGAFGGAAGVATRLTATLAYGGIAGGAAIGVAELVRLGNEMNNASLSAGQLSALAGKSLEDAAAAFKAGTALEGDAGSQIDKLTSQGAAGIGTILNLRDAALAAGEDTSKFDTALEQFNVTFDRTADTVARGTDYIDHLSGSEHEAAVEADYLAQASKRLESQTRNSASAAASLLTSQSSVVSAHNRVLQAQEAVANFGTDATAKSIREQRDEAAAVEDASQRIIDAQQHIIDARQKVADAQAALAEAGVHEQLAVADAQDAVDAAQRKLNASAPEERGPAQHALDDANQRLTDAKTALDRAKPDAERALADAVRGVDDAMRSEADAHRQLADAQDRQAESNAKAAQSAGDYQAAVDAVTEAQIAEAEAIAHQNDLLEQLASGIPTGPVEALGHLRQALKDLAGDLDPSSELAQRIMYLLASMTPEGAQQVLQIAAGGKVAKFAAGGDVFGGQIFDAGEEGPELLTRGRYKAPVGGGTVIPAGQTAQLLAARPGVTKHFEQHNHFYGDVDPYKAAREQRRELERFAMLAAR